MCEAGYSTYSTLICNATKTNRFYRFLTTLSLISTHGLQLKLLSRVMASFTYSEKASLFRMVRRVICSHKGSIQL